MFFNQDFYVYSIGKFISLNSLLSLIFLSQMMVTGSMEAIPSPSWVRNPLVDKALCLMLFPIPE